MNINQVEMKKLLKQLNTFDDRLHKRILTGAIKAGAKTIQDSAQQYAPLDAGDLRDSIKVKKGTMKFKRKQGFNKFTNLYYVGIDTSMGWYANIIEFGSRFVSADPFMAPAYELQNQNVLHAAKFYIKRRIDRITRGLR